MTNTPPPLTCIICSRKILLKYECDIQVKYSDQNSWYCPYCGQYNGFTADGDYNQESHLLCSTPNHKLNRHVAENNSKKVANNGFCKKCNLNQVNWATGIDANHIFPFFKKSENHRFKTS